jgi:hypothetical protein
MKYLIKNIVIFSLLMFPVLIVFADPIIPCTNDCGFNDLLKLVNNIINWIIMISTPVAAGVFAWAGIIYMTTGIADKKSEAKNMLQKVAIGFVFILAAWIIIGTIVKALLQNPSIVPINISINKFINLHA